MSALSRRDWIRIVPGVCASLCLAGRAVAQDSPILQDTDPEAKAIDYVSDAATVDAKKFPKYAAGQTCANCSLYAPDGSKPTGGCGIVYGKDVAAKGWCSSWEKKPG